MLSVLRVREISLMTGFSLIGLLFAQTVNWNSYRLLLSIAIMAFSYVLSVYALNSLADYQADAKSSRLKHLSAITKSRYWLLLVCSVTGFSLISLAVNIWAWVMCIAGLLLWCTYYLPPLRFKTTLVLGTAVHFLAGIIHFHSVYVCVANANTHSLLISVYFAMLLAVGHIHHEILDYNDDLANAHKTTAVRLGLPVMFRARSYFWLLIAIYWSVLYFASYTTIIEYGVFLLPTLLQLIVSYFYSKQGNAGMFQKIARTSFLVSGLILIIYRIIL